MGENGTGKPEADCSCHDVQGHNFVQEAKFELESLDFAPSLFETNVVNPTTNDNLKISSGTNSSSQKVEVEEGELVEGIEANDASGLLEQFLEYVEKQDLEAFKNLQEVHTDAMDPIFDDVVTNKKAREENLSVHSSSVRNGTANNDCDDEMDNHKTDHNYACRGFPRRTPLFSSEQCKHLESKSRKYKNSNSGSDSENLNETRELNAKERRGKYSSQRCSSQGRDADRLRSRSPLGHRSCHYKKNLDADRSRSRSPLGYSNCHYKKNLDADRSRSRSPLGHSSWNYKKNFKRDHSSSDDDESYHRRQHSKCRRHSSFSSDDKRFYSSDEDSMDERRRRHDHRQSGSGRLKSRRHSHDSDGDSYNITSKRRKHSSRRHSPDFLEKDFRYKKEKTMYDIEQERKMGFKFNPKIKDSAKEERRNIYIGKITRGTTEDDIRKRFRPFGPIEKITVHFREKGDNYAFVTFFEHSSAAEAIEQGNDDPGLPVLDICFGGRRKFCGGSYVDFDLNNSYLEEQETSRPPSPDEMDFDTLLKLSQKSVKGRRASCKGR